MEKEGRQKQFLMVVMLLIVATILSGVSTQNAITGQAFLHPMLFSQSAPTEVRQLPEKVFAVIGDYGCTSSGASPPCPYEAPLDVGAGMLVADMVDSWNPMFIVTVGDNNYKSGKPETIDDNIGKPYCKYIKHYTGVHCDGIPEPPVNKFWPALGNHDYQCDGCWDNPWPFTNYFTLPGDERQYDVQIGDIHLIIVDAFVSYGSPISGKLDWVKQVATTSSAKHKFVFMHFPPYATPKIDGSYSSFTEWQADNPDGYKDWGIDAVFAGHHHDSQLLIGPDGMIYVIAGNGGTGLATLGSPITESVFTNDDYHGAVKVRIKGNTITLESWGVDLSTGNHILLGTFPFMT